MRRQNRIGILEAIPLFLVVVLFIVGMTQVAVRFLLAYPLTWAEETMRLLFIFLVFTGAVVVTLKREHLEVDILRIWVKPNVSAPLWRFYSRVVGILMVGFFSLTSYGALRMAQIRWRTFSQTIDWWRVGYMYAIVGISLSLCAAISLLHVITPGEPETEEGGE